MMTPELILALMGALGLSGLGGVWWTRRAQRDHVMRVRTAWARAGQIVRYGPVGAVCLGHRPRRLYLGGTFGALGITDGKLSFDGHRQNADNLSVAFGHLYRVSLTTVPVTIRAAPVHRRALTVHYDSPDGWRVATFLTDSPVEFAQALGDESGLPVYDSGDDREDFGPARATRMVQNLYGEWLDDRDGDPISRRIVCCFTGATRSHWRASGGWTCCRMAAWVP